MAFPVRRFDDDVNHGRTWHASFAGGCNGVHTTGGDDFGLGLGIGDKDIQQGGKILIGHVVKFPAEQTADKAARYAALLGDVGLIEPANFGPALEGS